MGGMTRAAVCSLAAVCALAAIAVPAGAAYAQANAQVVPTDKGTLDIDFALDPDAVSAGEPARMKIDFVNAGTGRVQAHIDYEITVSADEGGAPVKSIPLTHTSSGSVSIPIEFESDGPHTVQIGVKGILFQPIPLETASIGLTIGGVEGGDGGAERPVAGAHGAGGQIPEWVRAIFAYYADGALSDAELLAAIQYLADQGVIQIAPPSVAADAPQPAAMSEDAEWAADEADFADAVAERLRDDMQAFRVDLRVGGYVPGEPEDYEDAFEAGRAEIRAVESYAGVLRSASADGRITAAEDAAIKEAGRAADEAEAAAYEAIMATPLAYTFTAPQPAVSGMPPGAGPYGDEHEHASILVVIFGDRFDFSGPSFQMQNRWIHFEAQDGTTIHRHSSGVTTGYLFETLDIRVDEDCYVFPDGREFCTNEDFELRYYVNGEQVDSVNDYVFDDQDRILVTYGNETPEQINEYLAELNAQPIVA